MESRRFFFVAHVFIYGCFKGSSLNETNISHLVPREIRKIIDPIVPADR